MSNSLSDAAKAAADAGNTVEAIKLQREATGCDLLTAKTAVDAYRQGHEGGATTAVATEPGHLPAEAVALLEQGQLIDAIRCVREAHQLGLKEAKESVEQYLACHTLVRERFQAANAMARNTAIHKLLNGLLLVGAIAALLVWLGVLPKPF